HAVRGAAARPDPDRSAGAPDRRRRGAPALTRRPAPPMLFPTTLVGSYPQPEWLIDRAKLAGRFPPRVRARELWRVPEPWLGEAAAALDYALAVNAEIRDLFAAGADVVQVDEPYMQARPEKARQFGLAALNRALEGVTGTTAVHICFGYAAIIHQRPSGYSFLP